MILSVRSNMPSFKEAKFTPGFNVVLADRTKESTRGDSRNGLGKTTLFEIIHFCLGSSPQRGQGPMAAPLKGWTFTLDIQIHNQTLMVTRGTDDPRYVYLQGDVTPFAHLGEQQDDGRTLRIPEWTTALGQQLFGISAEEPAYKYRPTFRSLISYLIRRGRDAFSSPFTHYRRQNEWDKQVNNAFLLGLGWEHAGQLQELKDQEKTLNELRRAARDGLLEGLGCVDILVMMLVCQMLSCQQNNGTGFSISCVAAPACMSLRKKIASDLSRPFCGLTAPAPNGDCFRPNTGIGTVSINDSPVGLTKASGNRCFNISPATRTWNT